MPIAEAEALPGGGNHRLDLHPVVVYMEAENFFDPDPIHPGGRAGIPRPAPLADPSRQPVDISRYYIGLNPIVPDRGGIAGVLNRIEDAQ